MTAGTIRPALDVQVKPGVLLLAHLNVGPSWEAHQSRSGELPDIELRDLLDVLGPLDLRGRGGAAFPLVRKLATTADSGRRREVVVNGCEGEAASAKDAALLLTAPHRVLDGAQIAALALETNTVHIVTGADRPAVGAAVERAIGERPRRPVKFVHHEAEGRFVSGQARAVLDLLAGGVGLPTTAWVPEAVSGLRGRPTLLSNAETFAQLGAIVRDPVGYADLGTPLEPGTSLLTLATPPRPDATEVPSVLVVEAEHGQRFGDVLGWDVLSGPALMGGFHGQWTRPGELAERPVSRTDLAASGLSLGAGVVVPMGPMDCPVQFTARIVRFLADESAGRCGPCWHGLPELARQIELLARGFDYRVRAEEVCELVERRGACAHPDGTARLVRSLFQTFPDVIAAHLAGRCPCQSAPAGAGS